MIRTLTVALIITFALPISVGAEVTLPDGLDLCEYYTSPSATLVQLSGELSEVSQGASFVVSGIVTNRGTVPIPTARVMVKIVDKDAERVVALLPSDPPEPIGVASEAPFSVVWQVPNGTVPGDYAAEAIVYLNDRFADVGTFDARLLGSPYHFSVVGEGKSDVYFVDEASVSAPESGQVSVSVTVENESEDPIKTTAEWTVYAWNGPRDGRRLEPISSEVKVHPESVGATVFTIPDEGASEYFVEGVMLVHGTPVTTYFTVARDGYRTVMLTTAGITADRTAGRALYACVVSADVPSDDVMLSVEAHWSILGMPWPFASKTFVGSVPASVPLALALPISSTGVGTVVATLSRGGEVVDTITVPYGGTPDIRTLLPYLVGALAVIVLIIIVLVVTRRRP